MGCRSGRPTVSTQERFGPTATGAHSEFPEQQPQGQPRERSIEHAMLTPVFGTSCPPKALSGVMRRFAYRKYSEGRAAHWLLLLAAVRVDAVESAATARRNPPEQLARTAVRRPSTVVSSAVTFVTYPRVHRRGVDAGDPMWLPTTFSG